ncbi:3' terminal RNA ribose 2'-O-methyltransferase Hen1 [Priestia koreensis]|uniref:3' terminal RNA ribose 2'-O-methyltransferase Hen1 n=1 Tax=Priestia koreensis TaxID=284581 RepID=UPI00203ACD8B|nr:3' terminal RNA ribose 2'-O-methyltransferase Hen1 [Priestia koreensis]MCM3003628.1 3' terminal RNA ribose 2'-O-methyltransferase Hen1 [Priestia koreensis]
MQLTIKAHGENADAISYLLAKNPNNLYERMHNGHLVRMFYTECTQEKLDVTFFVTPDSIELSRNRSEIYDITSYINDREFAVSSIFCTLLRTSLGTALNGKPKEEYQKWVDHQFAFQFEFGPLASDLSDEQIRNLFEPLGYSVSVTYGSNDYHFSMSKQSAARSITLEGFVTLQSGLRQLFVLIPVLDNYKHYFIDEKEVEKITRYGEGWLDEHPERNFILERGLRFKEMIRLVENTTSSSEELPPVSTSIRLNEQRYEKIIQVIQSLEAHQHIVDFGSGEGKLSVQLGFVEGVKEILAVEPSQRSILQARHRFEKASAEEGFLLPTSITGSLFYYDERFMKKDVMILCEVIEHIDEHRLPKVMDTILHHYQPRTLIVTTPNADYNSVYNLGKDYRHDDHRFEWSRDEFTQWCDTQNHQNNYQLSFNGIGTKHEEYGTPTQMCIFTRKEQ